MFKNLGKRSLTLLFSVLLFVMPSHGAITYAYYNQQPKISLWSLRKRPLIVWIHGCRQTERKFVEFSQIVEKTQLLDPLIIAPEIESGLNPMKCWNFFSKDMKTREGKFMTIIEEIKKHIDSGEVDPERVFVGGFSSGAAFANHLALCFPDVFKGALIHSGAPFQLSNGFSAASAEKGVHEALKCAENAGPHKLKTMLYVHGTLDPILPFFLGKNAFKQSIAYFDYQDDGVRNNSVIENTKTAENETDVTFSNQVSTHFIEISGMSHRWSGSKSGSAFSSPNTQSAIDSFLKLTSQLD
ncbi:MAG: alpha/beta hydrolase family esterase [Bdellovibrio sp.]